MATVENPLSYQYKDKIPPTEAMQQQDNTIVHLINDVYGAATGSQVSTSTSALAGTAGTLIGLLMRIRDLMAGTANWTAVHNPAAATQATITKAAGATGVRHVCTAILATLACGATAQTPITVYLRDGATGAGAILWTGVVAAPANGTAVIQMTNLNIIGTAATAMTLEFSAAGVAASLEAVALEGYDAS